MSKPRIEVYQYLGYHGTFAPTRTLLWRCEVVGANGERWPGGSWMSEGVGQPQKSLADADAKRWSEFTGWPIEQLGRAAVYDDPEHRNIRDRRQSR